MLLLSACGGRAERPMSHTQSLQAGVTGAWTGEGRLTLKHPFGQISAKIHSQIAADGRQVHVIMDDSGPVLLAVVVKREGWKIEQSVDDLQDHAGFVASMLAAVTLPPSADAEIVSDDSWPLRVREYNFTRIYDGDPLLARVAKLDGSWTARIGDYRLQGGHLLPHRLQAESGPVRVDLRWEAYLPVAPESN